MVLNVNEWLWRGKVADVKIGSLILSVLYILTVESEKTSLLRETASACYSAIELCFILGVGWKVEYCFLKQSK